MRLESHSLLDLEMQKLMRLVQAKDTVAIDAFKGRTLYITSYSASPYPSFRKGVLIGSRIVKNGECVLLVETIDNSSGEVKIKQMIWSRLNRIFFEKNLALFRTYTNHIKRGIDPPRELLEQMTGLMDENPEWFI